MNKELHKLIWLFLPIAIFLIPICSRMITDYAYLYMYMESGWVEVTTVLFLVTAVIFSLLFIKEHDFTAHAWFKYWILLLIFGTVYFAGEEISWGQHFFGWETPDAWQAINDQQETNLHNTSAIFDQIPRTLLSIAAIVGGILVPLFRKISNKYPDSTSIHFWLWPTYACLPVAVLSVFVGWYEDVYEILAIELPTVLDIRSGEVKESLLALFILMYVLSIWYRNRNLDSN